MTIELVKETDRLGVTRYSIELNGCYVDGTTTRDIKKAEGYYERVLKSQASTKEILKSETI
jgi:hypothetical protein